MNPYAVQIEAAAAAVQIHSPTSYSWFGNLVDTLTPQTRRNMTPATARSYLLYNLQHQLYADFYCTGYATPRGEAPRPFALPGETRFVAELSAANTGHGVWEGGWEARALEGDRIVVHKDGLDVWVREDECRPAEGAEIVPGAAVRVRFPKELTRMSPGFYVALGNEELDGAGDTLIRFYWHLTAASAVAFVEAATTGLNDAHVPFRLKVANDRARFDRCDCAVVYGWKRDYATIARLLLVDLYPAFAPALSGLVPALTKPLGPGVAFAEDPGTGDSFGLHRCFLIADGIVRAAEAGRASPTEQVETVAERFAENGLSLERPYLNAASTDEYAVPAP